jgi:hypothetical protein
MNGSNRLGFSDRAWVLTTNTLPWGVLHQGTTIEDFERLAEIILSPDAAI